MRFFVLLCKGAGNSWWMLEFMCKFTQDLMMSFGRAVRDFALPPPPSVPLPSSPTLQNKDHHCTGKTHSFQKTTAIRVSRPFSISYSKIEMFNYICKCMFKFLHKNKTNLLYKIGNFKQFLLFYTNTVDRAWLFYYKELIFVKPRK